MILRDTQRPVYTRKQSLLLTSDIVLRAAKKAVLHFVTYQSNISSCNLDCQAINRREGSTNKFVYNECVFIYHFTSLLYYLAWAIYTALVTRTTKILEGLVKCLDY